MSNKETTEKERGTDLAGRAEFALLGEGFIDSVEDASDESMKRARVHFKNGYQLSIIQGPSSYGGPEGLYEISPINKAGCLDGDLLDEEDQGDDVCGYCEVDKVDHYIRKIGGLT